MKTTTITIEIDDRTSENLEIKRTNVEDKRSPSMYARFFDEGCPGWQKDSEYNLIFLKTQQVYANDLLRKRGHLFLNDIYDMLGIPRTKAGQVVGWVYDKDNPVGDNYIDFGIYDERNSNFVNGYEKNALLDFNVDGIILERI